YCRDEPDLGSVLEIRRRDHAAREHVGHQHRRHTVDRRADRLRDPAELRSRRTGRPRWWWRWGTRRRFGGERGPPPPPPPPAAADPAANEHVRHGTDLPGRKEPARCPRVPAGNGLPQEAPARIRLSAIC